jgi:hypothetical protein
MSAPDYPKAFLRVEITAPKAWLLRDATHSLAPGHGLELLHNASLVSLNEQLRKDRWDGMRPSPLSEMTLLRADVGPRGVTATVSGPCAAEWRAWLQHITDGQIRLED